MPRYLPNLINVKGSYGHSLAIMSLTVSVIRNPLAITNSYVIVKDSRTPTKALKTETADQGKTKVRESTV